jgi:hypothetical protein
MDWFDACWHEALSAATVLSVAPSRVHTYDDEAQPARASMQAATAILEIMKRILWGKG